MTISHREFHQAANRARPGFRERLPKRKPSVPERHARKCVVCLHPKRAEIESAFLQWRSPKFIAVQYSLAGTHNIYRHAHATACSRSAVSNFFVLLKGLRNALTVQDLASSPTPLSALWRFAPKSMPAAYRAAPVRALLFLSARLAILQFLAPLRRTPSPSVSLHGVVQLTSTVRHLDRGRL